MQYPQVQRPKKYILLLEKNLARAEAENAELKRKAEENWNKITTKP